jgi:hypothetical protein
MEARREGGWGVMVGQGARESLSTGQDVVHMLTSHCIAGTDFCTTRKRCLRTLSAWQRTTNPSSETIGTRVCTPRGLCVCGHWAALYVCVCCACSIPPLKCDRCAALCCTVRRSGGGVYTLLGSACGSVSAIDTPTVQQWGDSSDLGEGGHGRITPNGERDF